MQGVDLSGYAGLKDRVNNRWARLIGGVVLSSLLSVAPTLSQGDVGQDRFFPTVGQQVASNVGANINRTGQQITQKNLSIQPIIEIRPGFSFNVMVNKDMILRPYQDDRIIRLNQSLR